MGTPVNISLPKAPTIQMDQGTFVVCAVLLAFLFFVTARGELGTYIRLLF